MSQILGKTLAYLARWQGGVGIRFWWNKILAKHGTCYAQAWQSWWAWQRGKHGNPKPWGEWQQSGQDKSFQRQYSFLEGDVCTVCPSPRRKRRAFWVGTAYVLWRHRGQERILRSGNQRLACSTITLWQRTFVCLCCRQPMFLDRQCCLFYASSIWPYVNSSKQFISRGWVLASYFYLRLLVCLLPLLLACVYFQFAKGGSWGWKE